MRYTNDEAWIPVIGQFMVAFGSIENSINELLTNTQTLNQMQFIMTLRLEQRITMLRRSLADWEDLSDKNKKVLWDNLDEIQHLARTRNLIAHNPLTMQMLYLPDPKDKALIEKANQAGEYIKHEVTQQIVTLPELTKMTKRAYALAIVMQGNWIEYDLKTMAGKEPVMKRPRGEP